MAYESTNWKAGDVVTSAKLNKMEQGISSISDILLVNGIKQGANSIILDKTWQEICDAELAFIKMPIPSENISNVIATGRVAVIGIANNNQYLLGCSFYDADSQESTYCEFISSTSNGYPTYSFSTEEA